MSSIKNCMKLTEHFIYNLTSCCFWKFTLTNTQKQMSCHRESTNDIILITLFFSKGKMKHMNISNTLIAESRPKCTFQTCLSGLEQVSSDT